MTAHHEQWDFVTQEDILEASIMDKMMALDIADYQMADLKQLKQKIEQAILTELNHTEVGEKTYCVGKYKICVNKDFSYSINAREYMRNKHTIEPQFDPIVEKTVYVVNKALLKLAQEKASGETLLVLSKFIKMNHSEMSIKIGASL